MISLKELCQICKVSRRVIQGYEKVGLISSCAKNKRGYLLYDESIVNKVQTIRLFQEFGFQIKEIKEVLNVSDEVLKMELIKKEKLLIHKRKNLNTTIDQIHEMIEKL